MGYVWPAWVVLPPETRIEISSSNPRTADEGESLHGNESCVLLTRKQEYSLCIVLNYTSYTPTLLLPNRHVDLYRWKKLCLTFIIFSLVTGEIILIMPFLVMLWSALFQFMTYLYSHFGPDIFDTNYLHMDSKESDQSWLMNVTWNCSPFSNKA